MTVSKSFGNMYKWVTHMWSPLHGACSHRCAYCYVKSGRSSRFYTGEIAFSESAMRDNLGKGRTIFVQHRGDLFAEGVKSVMISVVLKKLNDYPENTYLLQSKNPERMFDFVDEFPPKVIVATTIETDSDALIRSVSPSAPLAHERAQALGELKRKYGFRTELTIEPIMKFDREKLLALIELADPDSISIGADSKRNNLEEPAQEDILWLLFELAKRGHKLEELKENIGRLLTRNA